MDKAAINQSMILAIDAGNTRTKWGLFDEANLMHAQGAVLNGEIGASQAWRDCPWHLCKKAVVSNVAGVEIGAQLQALFDSHEVDSHWVKSSVAACGLINGYEQPDTLGSDRWLAMIAAWHTLQVPCVVVSAGTALTIDAITFAGNSSDNQARFMGGLILPGLQMMQSHLAQNTAQIGLKQGRLQDFPRNTGDAVYTGAIRAMAGAVSDMVNRLAVHQTEQGRHHTNRCMMTGGDANVLAEALHAQASLACEVIVVENLVLQGLLLIERNAV
ncbi:MAG TPA: type III pantothenate kinase [Methylophilaceae bacterium]|jgi:type III pantothenate kinase